MFAVNQMINLIDYPYTSSCYGCNCRSFQPEALETAQSENEQRIQNNVDSIRDPERSHSQVRLSRPSECTIDQKE